MTESPPSRRWLLKGLAGAPLVVTTRASAFGLDQASATDAVEARSFGVKGDGVTDDRIAMQAAIDACLARDPPRPLLIYGLCRIGKPLMVNRPVDRSISRFHIIGVGAGAGFLAAASGSIFDSTLAHGEHPQSEYLSFERILFRSADRNTETFVLTGRFLRVEFEACEFIDIKCLRSAIYAQEWRFYRCVARGWSGIFFASAGGYNIVSNGSKFQFGGAVFRILDSSHGRAGTVGCSFHQDIYESCAGPFLTAGLVHGLSIAGLYSEGNDAPTIHLDSQTPNRGISVTGCFFKPTDENLRKPDFFEIVWGHTEGGYSAGNRSFGRLHDNRLVPRGGLTSIADSADLSLVRVAPPASETQATP